MARRLIVGVAAAGVLAASAVGAGPPPPSAAGGKTVTPVAAGVPTPVAFAFAFGHVFVAGFGDEEHPNVKGGVYDLTSGKPVRLPGSPAHVTGVAVDRGTLYVSSFSPAGSRILAWKGWNGRRFSSERVAAAGPKGFTGFNGIAVGPDHLLYVGVGLSGAGKSDFQHVTSPYANSFLRVDPATGKLELLATGMRQPWQPIFVPGLPGPLVSDLGQENLGKKRPPDRLLLIQPGEDFGFPDCPASPTACKQYSRPFAQFPAHASPMGMGVIGNRLYVALFSGTGKGPEVVSMPRHGGSYTPFLTGFAAPVLAVGAHGGSLYVGDLTGTVYKVAV